MDMDAWATRKYAEWFTKQSLMFGIPAHLFFLCPLLQILNLKYEKILQEEKHKLSYLFDGELYISFSLRLGRVSSV